jgi:hypothetical protein
MPYTALSASGATCVIFCLTRSIPTPCTACLQRQLLTLPASGKPIAMLRQSHTAKFYPAPMLNLEGWDTRRALDNMLFENN